MKYKNKKSFRIGLDACIEELANEFIEKKINNINKPFYIEIFNNRVEINFDFLEDEDGDIPVLIINLNEFFEMIYIDEACNKNKFIKLIKKTYKESTE